MLFTAFDGEKTKARLVNDESQNLFMTAANLADCIITKLEDFVNANSGKIDSPKCMKMLVLVLKPLEETIKLCGANSEYLPNKWQDRINFILKSMSQIIPLQNQSKIAPPNSLIESYVQLTLLTDKDY